MKLFFFFFFQAEDGIRDADVTGVQTCALPICIKQALAIVGKLSHRPDSRLASPRLAFREAFPTALELFELRAMATGRGEELVREWRALSARVEKTRQAYAAAHGESAAAPVAVRRRRRRRGGREHRRAGP